MRITVTRTDLLRALTIAATIPPPATTRHAPRQPQRVTLQSQDGTIALLIVGNGARARIVIPGTVHIDGMVACPLRPLRRIVALLTDETVTLARTGSDELLHIKPDPAQDETRELALALLSPTDRYPAFLLQDFVAPTDPPSARATIATRELLRGMLATRHALALDHYHPPLENYHLYLGPAIADSALYVSDGFRAMRATMTPDPALSEIVSFALAPYIPALLAAAHGDTVTLARHPAMLFLAMGETQVWLRDEDTTIGVDKTYRELGPDTMRVVVERAALIRALRLATSVGQADMAGHDSDRFVAVQCVVGATTLTIRYANPNTKLPLATLTLPIQHGDNVEATGTFAINPDFLLDAAISCRPAQSVVLGYRGTNHPVTLAPPDDDATLLALVMPVYTMRA